MFLCYDYGFHLKKYAQNPQKAYTAKIASLSIVTDKMHYNSTSQLDTSYVSKHFHGCQDIAK